MNPPLPDPVRALIERERDVPPPPAGAHERIRARVRDTIAKPPPPGGLASKLVWPLTGLATAAIATFALWPSEAPRPATTVAPSIASHTPTPAPALSPAPALARAPAPAPAPAPTPSAPPAPEPAPPAPAPPAPAPAAPTPPTPEPTRDPARERTVLDRAQAALTTGDANAALNATQEHQRRWPRGALTEEREVLTLRAYVAAGQSQLATRAAEAFRKRYPRSIYRAVVDALLPPAALVSPD